MIKNRWYITWEYITNGSNLKYYYTGIKGKIMAPGWSSHSANKYIFDERPTLHIINRLKEMYIQPDFNNIVINIVVNEIYRIVC